MINDFYTKILNNLKTDKVFYKYKKDIFSYIDLNIFLRKYVFFLERLSKKKNNKVCIIADKSFTFYASIVCTLLCNNTWIPLSSSLPKDRIKKIIKSVEPDIVIYDKNNSTKLDFLLKKASNILLVPLESFDKLNEAKVSKRIISHKAEDISMIYFTSGSTGEPKGVPIKNKNFLPCFYSQYNQFYKNKKNLVFADFHDNSFVISLVILLPCIYCGATIVPAIDNKDFFMPLSYINNNSINVLITVPSFINQIKNNNIDKTKSVKLDIVIMCGETFYLHILDFLYEKINTKNIYNCYGSTEVSPWVFFYKCKKSDLVKYKELGILPIGKKFSFAKIKLINNELQIAGKSVVDGYLDTNLNKDKFFYSDNVLWYCSGDLVRKIENNYFIYGRKDSQIKINGFRVELLDIDTKIKLIKGVRNSIVFSENLKNTKKVIFAVLETQRNISSTMVREHLKTKLPNYMLPNIIHLKKSFPYNKNGKIDRKKIILECKKRYPDYYI